MSDRKSIIIRIDETHSSGTSLRLQADLQAPHRTARGLRMVSLHTTSKTLNREFSDTLDERLMSELVQAIALVCKNWYATNDLPFA